MASGQGSGGENLATGRSEGAAKTETAKTVVVKRRFVREAVAGGVQHMTLHSSLGYRPPVPAPYSPLITLDSVSQPELVMQTAALHPLAKHGHVSVRTGRTGCFQGGSS